MLHGLFDFVVMSIPILCLLPHYDEFRAFVIETSEQGEDYAEHDPGNFELESVIYNINAVTMILGIIIAIAGLVFYLMQSALQKDRLKALDREAAYYRSRLL